MKGQNRILGEILIFSVCILIASYIIVSFGDFQKYVHNTTINNDLTILTNFLTSAITKVSENDNSTIRLSIPSKISGNTYRIRLEESALTVSIFEIPSIKKSQQLFNIRKKITLSEVLSTAKFIEVVNDNGKIKIRRF